MKRTIRKTLAALAVIGGIPLIVSAQQPLLADPPDSTRNTRDTLHAPSDTGTTTQTEDTQAGGDGIADFNDLLNAGTLDTAKFTTLMAEQITSALSGLGMDTAGFMSPLIQVGRNLMVNRSQFMQAGALDTAGFITSIGEEVKHLFPGLDVDSTMLKFFVKGVVLPNMEKVLSASTIEGNDGKHLIIVLDSVRATGQALHAFTQALRAGKVRIRENGVRTIHGDSPEATKYGAGPQDKVIIISTESTGGKHP